MQKKVKAMTPDALQPVRLCAQDFMPFPIWRLQKHLQLALPNM